MRAVAIGLVFTLLFLTLVAIDLSGGYLSVFVVAPYFALLGLLATLVGGAAASFALVRRRERSVAAVATVPFFALALVVFVGELAQLLVWLL